MNINDIEQCRLEGLLTIFFNFKPATNNNFEVYSSYKKSKHTTFLLDQGIYERNNELLTDWSGLNFVHKGNKHSLIINNDGMSCDEFAEYVYKHIQRKRIDISSEVFERMLLIATFGLRGSIDIATNYFAVDILKQVKSLHYMDLIFKLLTNISDMFQLNFNFRELQQEYVDGISERNTQLRIDLAWFTDKIETRLSSVNLYKHQILLENASVIESKPRYQYDSSKFIDRILFYKNRVFNQIQDVDERQKETQIRELREILGFTTEAIEVGRHRNGGIVQLAHHAHPDECVCCKNEYDISARSFKMRKTGKYYFEIHHVIAFASDRNADQIDNLVKVCPTCHRALTKNRAEESYQKQLIQNILLNSQSAKMYVENFFDNPTEGKMIDFVYERLK